PDPDFPPIAFHAGRNFLSAYRRRNRRCSCLQTQGTQLKGSITEGEAAAQSAFTPLLAESSPAFCRRERSAELLLPECGRKTHIAFGTVVFETAGRDERTVARHRPGVLVAALDLVERIPFGGMIPVVDGA